MSFRVTTEELFVQVPAEEWTEMQRRTEYLEACLFRILRDREAVQEWFTIKGLAELKLPGLPRGRKAIEQMSEDQDWLSFYPSDDPDSELHVHVTELPARAFDALVARILGIPERNNCPDPNRGAIPSNPFPNPNTVDGLVPPWVLPMMRLMTGPKRITLGDAWKALPEYVPWGTRIPQIREAAQTLVALGLADWMEREPPADPK